VTRPMNGADTPSRRGFCQDHGFGSEIIDRLVMKLPGDVKGARDPRDITFLPDNNVALCARHGASISDVFGEMFALILVARLDGATLDNQGVGLKQRHHLIGLARGQRFVEVLRRDSDRRRISRDWFGEGKTGRDNKARARKEHGLKFFQDCFHEWSWCMGSFGCSLGDSGPAIDDATVPGGF